MVFRYLGFAEHRVQGTMFSSLVHQTIEDLHKTCLRGESVFEAQIENWFASNYTSLSLAMKTYLDETVGKIESYKFSNKGVKMCKATCDNCDLRYFYHFK